MLLDTNGNISTKGVCFRKHVPTENKWITHKYAHLLMFREDVCPFSIFANCIKTVRSTKWHLKPRPLIGWLLGRLCCDWSTCCQSSSRFLSIGRVACFRRHRKYGSELRSFPLRAVGFRITAQCEKRTATPSKPPANLSTYERCYRCPSPSVC